MVLTLWRPRLLGKTALVGITDYAADGTLEGHRQLVGTIAEVRPKEGILVTLQTGGDFWLPPDHRAIRKAPKGEYRLKSTGQIVTDPDYLVTWTLTKPQKR